MNASALETGQPRSEWRRRFLVTAAIAGGALVIGAWRFFRERDKLTPPAGLKPGRISNI